MNTNQFQIVSFHNTNLSTIAIDNVHYVAIRPIVEAIGLEWSTQSQKLNKNKAKFNCVHINTVANDGKKRAMLCMPIKKLNGWLFSINPEKVRADIKDKVIQYQEECFQVLHDYWNKGIAVNHKTTVDDRTGLRDAVNLLVSKKGLVYSDAYNLVHQYMGVSSIDEIPFHDLPKAVEYVHRLIVGENSKSMEQKFLAQKFKIIIRMKQEESARVAEKLQATLYNLEYQLNEAKKQLHRLQRNNATMFSCLEYTPSYKISGEYEQRLLPEAQAWIANLDASF